MFQNFRLAPVAFDEYVVIAAMFPAVIYPTGVGTRRCDPNSGRPYVRISIPAMVSALINVAFMRRYSTLLDDGARRSYFHDDLGAHRGDGQQAAGNRSQKSLFQFISPSLVEAA